MRDLSNKRLRPLLPSGMIKRDGEMESEFWFISMLLDFFFYHSRESSYPRQKQSMGKVKFIEKKEEERKGKKTC